MWHISGTISVKFHKYEGLIIFSNGKYELRGQRKNTYNAAGNLFSLPGHGPLTSMVVSFKHLSFRIQSQITHCVSHCIHRRYNRSDCSKDLKHKYAGLLPGDKSNKLITKGIFSISRNPMYLSLVILLLGLAFLINSYYLLIMIPFFIPIMQYGVIIKEERLLATHFGNEYKQYQGKVRRWI